jgi:hypothetical protein
MADFRNTTTYGINMKLLGRTFKSAKVLWGTSQYTFHSWNRRHKISATRGCSSRDLGSNLNSTNQSWETKQQISHTHSHTDNEWHINSYLVCEFLTFYGVHYNCEQDQKS